jgi:hypothetical protein
METKDKFGNDKNFLEKIEFLEDFQQWQRDILQMEDEEDSLWKSALLGTYSLKGGQRKMLTRALPRWINRKGIKTITRVLRDGEYGEGDKEILNEVRKWYLDSYSV